MIIPEWLYTIDILFAVLVIFFAIGGLRRGFSGELAHVLALTALLVGIGIYYPQLAESASNLWQNLSPSMIRVAVVATLLLGAVLLFFVLKILLKVLLKARMGEVTDKLVGALVGTARGILTGLAILIGLSLVPSQALYRQISEKSSVGGWVCTTLTPQLYPRIMELPVFDHVPVPSAPRQQP
ncbi:MAG: CvpA family protein [Kiritimatiellales bacterium]